MNSDFIIVSSKLIDSLKDFDVWKEFKNDPDFLENHGGKKIKKNNYTHYQSDEWDHFNGTNF
jgi:hypothetical protein